MASKALALNLKAIPIDRRITIDRAGREFLVAVQPRLDGEPAPSRLGNKTEADAFAAGLHTARGWPINDRTGRPS